MPNNVVRQFETKYARMFAGLFDRAPSQGSYNRYIAAKKEKFRRSHAARRIQTAFRMTKAKKAAGQLMVHHPGFRRLETKHQQKIMSLAYRL